MKKKKILFISANQLVVPYPVYPIGISYISTYLQEHLPGFGVELYDLNFNTTENLIKRLKNETPEYIGVSFRNIDDVNSYQKEFYINKYQDLIKKIRSESEGIIIIGGSGFSIFPELMFDRLQPDFGIYGEGEKSIVQLIESLENKSDYSDIEGLVYKKNGERHYNPRSNYLKSLDLSFNNDIIDFYWEKSGMLNVQTKRGCPFNCVYCTYPVIEGRKVRTLDPDKIVSTLKDLYYKRGIDYVFFTDSVFNIHNNYNYELADKIIKSKIDIKWGAYFTLTNLDEDLLKILKKSGLTHIEFGTEAIAERTLKTYGKSFTVDDVLEKSALCNRLDIDFAHFLILGGIGETDETVDETFANSAKIERSVFFPYVGMRIYPGTELHQIAIKEGVIDKNDDLLIPKYYLSDQVNYDTLKERAKASGKRWVFPDEDSSDVLEKLRKRNKKGPLWEYLIS